MSASGLIVDDGNNYSIEGNGITLGAGGITASTSSTNSSGTAFFRTPITLSAPQTWAIDGNNVDAQVGIGGDVTGQADALTVNLTNQTFLGFDADAEVGAVTVSGNSTIALGNPFEPGSLNGTDGNAVSLSNGTGLVVFGNGSSVGPLTLGTSSKLQVGQAGEGNGGASGAATLSVDSGLTLHSSNVYSTSINESGTTAGQSYSQLRATGPVDLGGAGLQLTGYVGFGECEDLTLGEVDTLITTTGSLTGTFVGVPDGTEVSLGCFSAGAGTPSAAVIHYTAHTVTATVVEGAVPPPLLPSTTTLGVSNLNPVVGESVTFTATVAPEPGEPAPTGEVLFLDSGKPIAACESQPLTPGASSSTATCTVSYGATGGHRIAARYLGSGNYEESLSAEQGLTVQAPPSGTTPTPPPPTPTGSVAFPKTTLTAKPNGQVSVPLGCTGTATCEGALTLTAKGLATKSKKARLSKVTAIGKAAFVIPAGKSATVKVKLNATGRALLKAHHGKLTATLTITKSSPSPASTVHKTVHIVQKGGK